MIKEICEVRRYGGRPFEAVLVGDKKRADSASLLIHGRRGLARRMKIEQPEEPGKPPKPPVFVVYANDDGSENARVAIDDLKKRYPIPKAD